LLFFDKISVHDVAGAMAHITSLKIVHRDLALRNLLYDKDKKEVKVSDFGLGGSPKDFEEGEALPVI
jgi:serine/threonine protein kinase